ncbi:hypothetical protein EK21DRAFT_100794 [Setomelanomma holmii]|uniref:Xylanolytic transcriptional activator regulatory domain-containing protein n=1 Tax=Setomelanomma holmii TaxID=210430 RepID=A0A9P4LNM3_9PLEO|nr:hypothetical protein EK21DRAFT_100794 [Setomelanomma holmii]
MQTLTIPASVTKRKQACKSCRQRKKKCDLENLDFLQLPGSNFDLFVARTTEYPSTISTQHAETATDQQNVMDNFRLPPHELLQELVQLFFDHLYHMFPIFHRGSFETLLQEGILEKESPLILYAICCVAARYHPDASVQKRGKDWYAQAKFNYDLTQRDPHPALRTIQAALVLILHAYTTGDFSAGWLFLGKAWRQAVALGINRMDASNAVSPGMKPMGMHAGVQNRHCQEKPEVSRAVKEEYRRTLWLMFAMDRNMAWPTAWFNTVAELHFKIDIPIADTTFQAMDLVQDHKTFENATFTPNFNRLIEGTSLAKDPHNIFHYICIAHVLLGRVSELVHSLHHVPGSPEYANESAELDSHIIKFQLSLSRNAISVFQAAVEDRAHVVWLQVMLNTCTMILHYHNSDDTNGLSTLPPFVLAVTAARNIAQIVKDASRISTDLLMSAHIASSLYVAACILVIEWRITGDDALRRIIELFELVFDRMNEVFVFLGIKFKFALEHDMRKSKEELAELRLRGFRGLMADCTKWTHVKEEVQRRGLLIDIT